QIKDLDPGTWQLAFNSWSPSGDTTQVIASTTVQIEAGVTATVRVSTVSAGSVSGRLLTSDGDPAPSGSTASVASTGGAFTRSANVASDGGFRIGGLPPGSYTVSYWSQDASGVLPSAVVVTSGTDTSAGTITIPRSASVSTTVRDADGNPIANASVWLTPI